uniref:Receptor ligand binding region domain-containing protein n=1 Tax=Astatotilapia calliptera TaxID=8154 RepID=A0A3P8PF31_ASTCA
VLIITNQFALDHFAVFLLFLCCIISCISLLSVTGTISSKWFYELGFRLAQTMLFAIDEINRNSNLLPNVTLGYTFYDNCVELGIAFRAALSLVSGQEEKIILDDTCVGNPPVIGIVGDSSSTPSIAISSVLGLYRVPMVSFQFNHSMLFLTIPSDAFQVHAMINILKHFGWTWAGLLVSDDDYGFHAARALQSELSLSGEICLAYVENCIFSLCLTNIFQSYISGESVLGIHISVQICSSSTRLVGRWRSTMHWTGRT